MDRIRKRGALPRHALRIPAGPFPSAWPPPPYTARERFPRPRVALQYCSVQPPPGRLELDNRLRLYGNERFEKRWVQLVELV
jgi:hypothetical protein